MIDAGIQGARAAEEAEVPWGKMSASIIVGGAR